MMLRIATYVIQENYTIPTVFNYIFFLYDILQSIERIFKFLREAPEYFLGWKGFVSMASGVSTSFNVVITATYSAQKESELSVTAGDIVLVSDGTSSNDWL